MDHKVLTKTIKTQRNMLTVQPMHAMVDPVRAYAAQIAAYTGESYSVVTIPDGSTAYSMGYRYASIPQTELAYYLANGASLAA